MNEGMSVETVADELFAAMKISLLCYFA